jgi:hypothetical protein
VSVPGILTLEKDGIRLKINYDPAKLEPTVETVSLPDKRLSNVWGAVIYRLSLTAKKLELSGKYTITINRN